VAGSRLDQNAAIALAAKLTNPLRLQSDLYLRPNEDGLLLHADVARKDDPRTHVRAATPTNFGTSLEPLKGSSTNEERGFRKLCRGDNGLFGGRTRTRTLDPLIKSQLAQLKYQRLAGKLVAFSGITDQTVTIQMQTANWGPAKPAVPSRRATV
jgi:hypothetical protein